MMNWFARYRALLIALAISATVIVLATMARGDDAPKPCATVEACHAELARVYALVDALRAQRDNAQANLMDAMAFDRAQNSLSREAQHK